MISASLPEYVQQQGLIQYVLLLSVHGSDAPHYGLEKNKKSISTPRSYY